MKYYISHYEYTLNASGRVQWARDLISGKIVARQTVQDLLSNHAPVKRSLYRDNIDLFDIAASLLISLVIAFILWGLLSVLSYYSVGFDLANSSAALLSYLLLAALVYSALIIIIHKDYLL